MTEESPNPGRGDAEKRERYRPNTQGSAVDLTPVLSLLRRLGFLADIESPTMIRDSSGRLVVVWANQESPTESDVKALMSLVDDGMWLLFAMAPTPYLEELLTGGEKRVIVVDVPGETVWLHGRRISVARPERPAQNLPTNRFHAFALARALLLRGGHATMSGLAESTRVRNALCDLAVDALGEMVTRKGSTVSAVDRESLWAFAVEEYPGASGLVSYWSASSVPEAVSRLTSTGAMLLSGEVAAARLAPGPAPTRVIAYLREFVAPASLGFELADKDRYDVSISASADPYIAFTAKAHGIGPGFVDPVMTAHDLLRTAHTCEEHEAVDRLRQRILRERYRPAGDE
jgi:hypothetical protein